eukprot:TRINITY_DN9436_c0_g1_i1.p1 TRINITY_DN9436_c0_g1~~TRINITY_DN9436_c0_g1_i1.p1  ORF type:complete len:1539 (+),score=133.59 TRINITY_DN9436_c0_g1_i1:107-4723(+)
MAVDGHAEVVGHRHRLPPFAVASIIAILLISLSTKVCGAQSVKTCAGYDEEWDACPGLLPCDLCIPVNCTFGDWESWYSAAGCIGLLFRHRAVKVLNNGCGQPCQGNTTEARSYAPERCFIVRTDCQFSPWSQWIGCSSLTDQRYRTRAIISPAVDGGRPCAGDLKQTAACDVTESVLDCALSPWLEWSECSASCGRGVMTRIRRISTQAKHGGAFCVGAMSEAGVCRGASCPSRDCRLGNWSDWTACSPSGHPQRHRHRSIAEEADGTGRRCDDALSEIDQCNYSAPEDCVLSNWGEWGACDKSCDGGQAFRARLLQRPSDHGGKCPLADLIQTTFCNTQRCVDTTPYNCKLSAWSEWTACSALCGRGSATRVRSILRNRKAVARGCRAPLKEITPCNEQDCKPDDCAWSGWHDWGACSMTCGGGSRQRSQTVSAAPAKGGKLCDPLPKSESAACNTEPCPMHCVNGTWDVWQQWTVCSASCGGAYRSRHRDMAVEANYCGERPKGISDEFAACPLESCGGDRDCLVSDWGHWSPCSTSCFGVAERSRRFASVVSGKGKPCASVSLKELVSCNTIGECAMAAPQDCTMLPWSMWSSCAGPCGGGHRERHRRIDLVGSPGGRPCDGNLTVTEPCTLESCSQPASCLDCLWSQWEAWTACSGCRGEKMRGRTIEQSPNFCGRLCDTRSSSEVTNCTVACLGEGFCSWNGWSESATCDTDVRCGWHSQTRSRALGFHRVSSLSRDSDRGIFFPAATSATCSGTQLALATCKFSPCGRPCAPEPCTFSAWDSWSSESCDGLCERSRSVESVNNECGTPCEGPLIATKQCPNLCVVNNSCIISVWSAWSECKQSVGQKYRSRVVEQQPENGGRPCKHVLSEVQDCEDVTTTSCHVSAWAEWSPCYRSCGGGWQTRLRVIVDFAQGGGLPCTGSLQELQSCGNTPCSMTDCLFGFWSVWSTCRGDSQSFRQRSIRLHARGGGAPCIGNVREAAVCGLDAVNCVVSMWTSWDPCDKMCGGGQQQRARSVVLYPQNGGKACPPLLSESQGCSAQPCDLRDCEFSEWGFWSVCSSSCGVGQQHRERAIASERTVEGVGCEGELAETRACGTTDCVVVDCTWESWSEWGLCSSTCGGGQRTRRRRIEKAPEGGGKPCVAQVAEQVEGCGLGPCHNLRCVDGLWAKWSAWSPCSRSCGGGLTFRKRTVAQMASSCGVNAAGKDQEVAFCNMNLMCDAAVHCAFAGWGEWSACSSTCNGIMERERSIAVHGRGSGAYCQGGLKDISPCNPFLGHNMPADCKRPAPVNCKLTDWSIWTQCPVTCGGGIHTRSRSFLQLPEHGGLATCYTASLSEVGECGRDDCPGPAPVDCHLGDWEPWGQCSHCDGQRTRFRIISSFPANGGKPCEASALEETTHCQITCGSQQYCGWAEWLDWSTCTTSCGSGKRSRRRYLALTDSPAHLPNSVATLGLADTAQHMTWLSEEPSFWESLTAFAGGILVFLVCFAAFRSLPQVARRRRVCNQAPSNVVSDALALRGQFVRLPLDETAFN